MFVALTTNFISNLNMLLLYKVRYFSEISASNIAYTKRYGLLKFEGYPFNVIFLNGYNFPIYKFFEYK